MTHPHPFSFPQTGASALVECGLVPALVAIIKARPPPPPSSDEGEGMEGMNDGNSSSGSSSRWDARRNLVVAQVRHEY